MKYIYIFPLIFFLLFLPLPIFAKISLTFTTDKTSLAPDEELTITATYSGFINGQVVYIKGAFFKEGSSNYFGYTKNNDEWIKNSAKTLEQRKVTIGEWDGIATIKSDPADSGFSDSGIYKFKFGFYTLKDSGEPNSIDWSDTIVDISLEKPSPTPTFTPFPTRTPAPPPTSKPTATPKPTERPVPTATIKIISSLTPVIHTPTQKILFHEDILGTHSADIHTTTGSGEIQKLTSITPSEILMQDTTISSSSSASRKNIAAGLFVAAGGSAGLGGVLLFRTIKKNEVDNEKL